VSDSFHVGSAARLWQLVAQRAERGADVAAIDERIWDLFGEQWTVVFTDLSGFSRRVEEFGIIHFLQIIYEHKKLLLPLVVAHDGFLVKTEGDSLLLLFRKARRAVECSLAMLRACDQENARRRPEEQILLCIGIGCGPVLRIGDDDVWGREVNAASKLGEDRAKAGEVLITEAVRKRLDEEGASGWSLEPLDADIGASAKNFRLKR
jgi:class 3 adenylate cyclase